MNCNEARLFLAWKLINEVRELAEVSTDDFFMLAVSGVSYNNNNLALHYLYDMFCQKKNNIQFHNFLTDVIVAELCLKREDKEELNNK
ncbi:MAG: hypothetical protein ACFFFC_00645 [Candidatus Thorarchaeota archaeon]